MMCGRLLLACCVLLLLPVLLAAEQQDRLYLIWGSELRSIEEYKANRDVETQNWLLQVQRSKAELDIFRINSATLNNQLSQARNQNVELETLYNKSEAEKLTLLSQKNGEIADLKGELATEKLETEKHKGTSRIRMAVIIALAGSWVLFIGFKVYWFFRPTPKIV
jgi:hypothetical protein